MKYDPNGYILNMSQKGWKISGSTLIDSLLYTYGSNSNKLQNVIDVQNDTATKLGDFRSSKAYMTALSNSKTNAATDYTYDNNGNLLKDFNKDIGNNGTNGITYNHLNLPYKIWVAGKGTITYTYDATGNKLEKRTYDSTVSKRTLTTYLGGYVYQNDTLQFFAHEEGRIRKKPDNSFVYDYFLKDHLGNTRMVLTEEYQQDTYPVATLEDGATGVEQTYYNINSGAIVSNPGSLPGTYANSNGNPPYNTNPNSVVTATSAKMHKLNGNSGDKTGLGISLKVMSGDTVNIYGRSYWHGSSPNNSYTTVVNDLLTALAGTSVIAGAGKGATSGALIASSVTPSDVSNLLSSEPTVSGRPNAYINWILFDEQFRVVSASSGFDPVNTSTDALKTHSTSVNILKNGYLYVYCSNESNQDVFFDNLQVIHNHGPLLEETHYYPFGLTMAWISSKAAGKLENRCKYNGGNELQSKEFSDGSGLEMYDAVHRMYDPQLGRFGQIDKLSELSIDFTTYGFARNNPIRMNDPLGLKEDTVSGKPLPEHVGKPVSRKEVASKAMNQMDYGQIAAWVDMKRQKGNTIETIRNWALDNSYLNNSTLSKVLDATGPHALAIRESEAEWWKAEGAIYKTLLELAISGGTAEVAELLELKDGLIVGKFYTEGLVNDAKGKVINNLLKAVYKKFGRQVFEIQLVNFYLRSETLIASL